MKTFREFLNDRIEEGYNTMVIQMRLRQLVLDSYRLNEDEISYIKKELDGLRKKYKSFKDNLLIDYLINSKSDYDLIEIFKLDDLEFIKELDSFTRITTKKLKTHMFNLSITREYLPDVDKELDFDDSDILFTEDQIFINTVNQFNRFTKMISDYFKLIKLEDPKESRYFGKDISRLINNKHSLERDIKSFKYKKPILLEKSR